MAALMLCFSCKPSTDGPHPEEPTDPTDPSSLWVMENDPVEQVKVYAGTKLLETYKYEYDDMNRLTRLVRRDETSASTLMDLTYRYEGALDVVIEGTFGTASKRAIYASVDEDDWNLTYKGNWDGAMDYALSMDEGTPSSVVTGYDFSAPQGWYSSRIVSRTKYDGKNGDISSSVTTTDIKTSTDKKTGADNSSRVTCRYTYSDREDLQNFAAYLIPCNFAVWYAKELPKCRHLITGMTMYRGNVLLPESFSVEYEFNDNGSIKSATRTDLCSGKAVAVRKYVFSYL